MAARVGLQSSSIEKGGGGRVMPDILVGFGFIAVCLFLGWLFDLL
jgi:hypothetical protein